ncbi:PREDICTED: translation initiation factor eIF-2B subunit delta [Ceratosolen solmsi marchali]|uniref:Translation initiation factor eIF2B subunit delta n=1 Tax=Ceratosolen solmsi marchali TaxID=326594 RepID=A0AAJ6YW36_9HYME|nr:PREDICTED: translation initiation factor eIF-2B subunit delta [Ceratosolen solmsi marchali]
MDSNKKSRETIKAEREAKKIAKAAAKKKGKIENKINNEPLTEINETDKLENQKKSEIKTDTNNECVHKKQIKNTVVDQQNKIDEKNQLIENKKENKQKIEEKNKLELRAERRAKQEAQRAAKQALLTNKLKTVEHIPEKIQEKSVTLTSKDKLVKTTCAKSEIKENLHEVNLFKHLYINKRNISEHINNNNLNLHPTILRLGVQYSEKVIVGSNARCVALLAAVKQLIEDFERPSQADFTRGLETSLQQSLKYLNSCRPSAVSMQNAVKHLKWQMSTLPSTISDKEGKLKLENAIDTYIQEQILLADKAISNAIKKKILNGDVILTYGFSSVIHKILCDAYTAGKQFRVIIVDGRPWLEGKELLRRLIKHGIDCSYVLINALSFIMPQVSKVFLGAHAILANGAVMSRAGTAQVALIANAFNVPVLVACETHKSCERVQTDSIVYNEIGDPNQLITNSFGSCIKSRLSNWKTKKTLNLLNITYDVTPANLVTAVVTELAILPCTSVPVILRIKPSEI